jgi:hypothetical protein
MSISNPLIKTLLDSIFGGSRFQKLQNAIISDMKARKVVRPFLGDMGLLEEKF